MTSLSEARLVRGAGKSDASIRTRHVFRRNARVAGVGSSQIGAIDLGVIPRTNDSY